MRRRVAAVLALAVLAAGCAGGASGTAGRPGPAGAPGPHGGLVDPSATPETRALFANLRVQARRHVMFGHQDDLAYGVTWRADGANGTTPGRSDVRETTGAYPAVYGWDAGHIELADTANLDRNEFGKMRRWIEEGYARGGVITLSWHLNNPVSGGMAWDTMPAVAAVLPGGPKNGEYRVWLDRLAAFIGSLRGPSGEPIPIVFRPYHEMSGSWFWWGARHCTPEQYRTLWRFTVQYLRDARGLHNLLYAYSPDVFDSKEQYLARYPGDAWVDVLGFDDYQSIRSLAGRPALVRRLRDVVELAEARGKVPALTETGLVTIPDSTWWTGTLLAALKSDAVGRRVAWVLVWRNANQEKDRPGHYYAPYPGQASAADFVRFKEDPLILFEDELPDLYRAGAPARRPMQPHATRGAR